MKHLLTLFTVLPTALSLAILATSSQSSVILATSIPLPEVETASAPPEISVPDGEGPVPGCDPMIEFENPLPGDGLPPPPKNAPEKLKKLGHRVWEEVQGRHWTDDMEKERGRKYPHYKADFAKAVDEGIKKYNDELPHHYVGHL